MNYRQCTATSKRTKERCMGRAMNGSEVCYFHGGKTPRGAQSPNFKTGRHSKYLPARMVAAYEDALADPELLDLNQSIALIDTRLVDLLGRVDNGEPGKLWFNLRKAFSELDAAIRLKDTKVMAESLAALDELTRRGASDYAAWGEIGRLLEDRRKQVETKQRVELQGERAVSANELMTLMSAVLHIIQSTVSDKQERIQIADGIQSLITPRTPQVH
jgi:hypothetical protein